jgi:hypothetical protein
MMPMNLRKTARVSSNPLMTLALAYLGIHFFRKLYPEARRYLRLHAM